MSSFPAECQESPNPWSRGGNWQVGKGKIHFIDGLLFFKFATRILIRYVFSAALMKGCIEKLVTYCVSNLPVLVCPISQKIWTILGQDTF